MVLEAGEGDKPVRCPGKGCTEPPMPGKLMLRAAHGLFCSVVCARRATGA